jgi:cell division protein FtsB
MKTQRSRKDRLLTYLYLAILVFLILFLFFNKYGLLKYFEIKKEINAIESKIENSQKEIEKLDSNIQMLKNSDKELEKVAREKFHMKKENEKAFKFDDERDTLK